MKLRPKVSREDVAKVVGAVVGELVVSQRELLDLGEQERRRIALERMAVSTNPDMCLRCQFLLGSPSDVLVRTVGDAVARHAADAILDLMTVEVDEDDLTDPLFDVVYGADDHFRVVCDILTAAGLEVVDSTEPADDSAGEPK